MPQEEWPQLFTDIVADFVARRVAPGGPVAPASGDVK